MISIYKICFPNGCKKYNIKSIIKRLELEKKCKKEKKNQNINNIKSVLELEMNDNSNKIKIFNILFHMTLRNILYMKK